MSKATPAAVLDKMADYLATTAGKEHVCSGQPANYAGIAAVMLAEVAVSSGDWTKAAGDVSGRKTTLAQKSAITISNSGTATHIAVSDASATLLYVTTCTSQALTAAGTVTVPAWKIEIADPA